jgi:hypothetical protein
MINIHVWQVITWQIFHKLTLHFKEENREHIIAFFEAFKTIIPCSICRDHYIINIKKYNLHTEQNLFQMTVQLHNSVNKMHNKPPWSVEKARNHYNSIGFNKNMIKLFFMNYIFYNFKKGPNKTDQLFNMTKAFVHLVPQNHLRNKLIDFKNKFPMNRDTFRKWIYTLLLIVNKEI